MKSIALFANLENPLASELARKVSAFLAERGAALWTSKALARHCVPGTARAGADGAITAKADFVVVLGGDGTLLAASAHAAAHHKPILGVNLGRLGYLTPVGAEEALEALDLALKGRVQLDRRVMLKAQVLRERRVAGNFLALNDIVVTKGSTGRIVELETFVNGEYLTTYRADGLILATPTGSTAYSLSVGGPILHTRLSCLVLVPISPHTLSNRPLVVSDRSVVEVVAPSTRSSVLVTADGREGLRLRPGDRVRIQRARESVSLMLPPGFRYWQMLRSKLGWRGN